MAYVDPWFRSIILTKFFSKGWGHPEHLRKILAFRKVAANRETCQMLVSKDYPVEIEKEVVKNGVRFLEGSFISPIVQVLPGVMPKESEVSRFQLVMSEASDKIRRWQSKVTPVCIHMAGTGDHGYTWRTRRMARPLLEEAGIASILIENPYYGTRKPKDQFRSGLLYVSDLFVMGAALILESLVLYQWCQRHGLGPLAWTGISLGGFMSSLAACNIPAPVSVVPCLSWTTASLTYTTGALSDSIHWSVLQDQYVRDRVYQDELSRYIYSPEDHTGRINHSFRDRAESFMKNYPTSGSHEELLRIMTDRQNHFPQLSSHYDIISKQFHSSRTRGNVMSDTTGGIISSQDISKTSVDGKIIAAMKSKRVFSLLDVKRASTSHSVPKPKPVNRANVSENVISFMSSMMDECTHMGSYSAPFDPELATIVTAKHDRYIPREPVMPLTELWPGASVRVIDTDHIAGVSLYHKAFRDAIIETFDRHILKYYPEDSHEPRKTES